MTAPHLSGFPAGFDQIPDRRKRPLPFVEDRLDPGRIEHSTRHGGEDSMVGLGDIPERRHRAPVGALLGRGVELRYMVGERVYQRPVEFSRLGERIEQQRLVEPGITTTQSIAEPFSAKATLPAVSRASRRKLR